jgi:hypothetical protein
MMFSSILTFETIIPPDLEDFLLIFVLGPKYNSTSKINKKS